MRKILIIGLAALSLAGCTGSTQGDRALAGGGIGAATGAVIGGLATGRTSGAVAGALIGGATGAVVGAATTPQCQAVDRRGRPVFDAYGNPITVPCP
jgi:uncharacterized protein YcfJ